MGARGLQVASCDTFAVLILNAFATFRNREDAGAFGRRFDGQIIKNAATIAMLYFMLFFFGGITISVYEGLPVLTCFYEAASAVGTVGLSTGITRQLNWVSQIAIMLLMFGGRIGTVTFASSFAYNKKQVKLMNPEENVNVG